MYFIVNKENFVIAASEKFIQKIGARDICLISSMYKDGSIVIDKENKSMKVVTKELEFDYEKSKLYSSFGELTHFRLYDKEEKILEIEENDDISYLKKIKKGVIEKEDNEFDIPKIAAIQEDIEEKSDKEDNESSKAIPEIVSEIENINILNEEPKDDITKEDENNTQVEKEDIELKDKVLTQDNKELEESDNSKEDILQKYDIKEDINQNEEEVQIPPIPVDKIREKQKRKEQQKELETVDSITVDSIKEKIVKIEDTTPTVEEKKDKKSLFPWKRNKSEDNVEDEINTINFKENEAIELKDIDIKEDSKQEIDLKDIDIKEDSKQKIDLKDEETSLDNKKLNKDLENLIHEIETIDAKETTSNNDNITLIKKPQDSKNIELDNNNIIAKIAKVQVESLDLEDNAKRLNLDIDSYKMLLNSYINEFNRVENLIEIGDNKTIDMLIDAGQLLALDTVVLKLTKLKNSTDEQDLKHNSNEIHIYIDELKNKISGSKESNDESLEDTNIKPNNNIEPIDDIQLKSVELKDESNKEEIKREHTENENKIIEDKKELIEDDIFESDKTLLDSVDKKDVTLELDEASEALQIPKELVLEFSKDFLTQSKEYLPILMEEYKKGDIKSLKFYIHSLKGASSNLRLNSFTDIFFKIIKNDDLNYIKELIVKFASLIKGLEEVLNKMEKNK